MCLTSVLYIGSDNDSSWNATIQINGQSVVFKLDTGAEVKAITQPTLTKLGNVQLHTAAKSLCGPDRKPLKVMGTLTTELAYTNSKCKKDNMNSNHCQAVSSFPKLFTGLGTFKGNFEITIHPEAKPFAIYTPSRVPIPLRQ